MASYGLLAVLVAAAATCSEALALSVRPGAARLAVASPRLASPVRMQLFGKSKTAEEVLEAKGYWPGEWVCADCGYIYEPGTKPAFEELRPRWKCPQCAGPRRRFVKKAGGQYGTIDDTPLFIGTGLAIAFIIFAVYIGLTV